MQSFLIALQFLTRIPLNFDIQWNDKSVAASLLYYPVVGVIIGVVLVIVAGLISGNEMLGAAIVLTVWVMITGGLHLDGLADSADAWVGSHGDKQRALDIMKDPQAGLIAVIVLLMLLLIKFSALFSLIKQMESELIVLSVAIGRCVPLILFLTTKYVREQGLGSAMSNHLSHDKAKVVLFLSAIICLMVMGFVNGMLLIALSMLVLWLLRFLMIKHIGGMTGDTIGASIEIIEALVLCIIVLLLGQK